ncbi:hypothetical protein MKW94_013686 [Papaver nudicaule]|uniref:CASP-like protein n=1 Tax=Papaver nudicaule TaxID=74823 RepID=A0AA41S926_PAPNU|nr:hypothetical protein [Papaver nudicaule]
MENSEETATKTPVVEEPGEATKTDVESGGGEATTTSSIVRRWRIKDLLKKGSLVLRIAALVFSILSFIIMASNKHRGQDFDDVEEYRYVLAISILSTLYTGFQVGRHVHHMSTGISLFDQRTAGLVDFFGDQIVAYLLISSASAAVPHTNWLRENADNIFTDTAAASISMAFFAFFSLAVSAMISGYKISAQNYI